MVGLYRIDIGPYYYYGSSNQCEKREREHFNMLDSNRHYNQKMQNVYNKHRCFAFDVVEQCETEQSARDVEQSYLDLFYGSRYCMNLSGEATRPPKTVQKTHWNGKWYPSRILANNASSLNLHINDFRNYYIQGFRSDEEVKEARTQSLIACNRRIEWNGRLVTNKEVWKRLGISSDKLSVCVYFGAKNDEDVFRLTENSTGGFSRQSDEGPNCKLQVYWNDRFHKDWDSAVEHSRYSKSKIIKWSRLGAKSDADATRPKREKKIVKKPYTSKWACGLFVGGNLQKEYISATDAAKDLGLTNSVVTKYMRLIGEFRMPDGRVLVPLKKS